MMSVFLFLLMSATLFGCEDLTEELVPDPEVNTEQAAVLSPDAVEFENPGTSDEAALEGKPGPRREWVFESRFQFWQHAPYRWMENDNDPELVNWIETENQATARALEGSLYDELYQEFTELLQTTRMPTTRALDVQKKLKRERIQQHYFRKMAPHRRQPNLPPFTFVSFPSPSGQYEAEVISDAGSDLMRLEIVDTSSGHRLRDLLMVKWPDVFWEEDEESFLYVTMRDGRMRHVTSAVYRHRLGTSQAEDTLIYQADQPAVSINLYQLGENWMIYLDRGYRVDLGWFDVETGDISPILENISGPIVPMDYRPPQVYAVLYSEAPKGEVVAYNLAENTQTTVVPEGELAIDEAVLIGDSIYLTYVEDAASKLVRFDLNTGISHPIALPKVGWIMPIPWEEGMTLVYQTNYIHAYSIYLVDEIQNSVILLEESPPPPFELEAFRTFYQAHNGQAVPIWIVKRPDVALSAKTPTLLYGYGGFSINILPYYDVRTLPWLERGGVMAYVTLPGGLEYGEAWHQAGMGHNKKNVFDDFAAAGYHLIAEGYTSRRYLAANGGSNGGLLVGATVNRYPRLFHAAVPEVGVLDMTRFELFTGGYWWVSEYGDRDQAGDYANLRAISPLHNIRHRRYPATLVMTSEYDDRVVPSHSYKYAAQLKRYQKANRPILLHTARWASHGIYATLDEEVNVQATRWTFLMKQLGLGR